MAASKNKNTKDRAGQKVEEAASEETKSWESRITQLLMRVEEGIDTGKSSVSDFIRLMQVKRECEQESVKEIVVTWVGHLTE